MSSEVAHRWNDRLRWFASELIVVVAGVLIALALNSWWANLQDRKREHVLLLEFREEFVENQRLLDIQSEVWRRRKEAAQRLLELGPAAAELPDSTLNEHWGWLTRSGSYDPVEGAIQSAIASGSISLIEDPEVTLLLARWRGELSDVAQVEHQFWTLIHRDFLPWMRMVTALPDSGYGSIGFESGHFETDFHALHSSVVLENFLREYIALSRVLDNQRGPLEKTITAILEKVEEHLEHG